MLLGIISGEPVLASHPHTTSPGELAAHGYLSVLTRASGWGRGLAEWPLHPYQGMAFEVSDLQMARGQVESSLWMKHTALGVSPGELSDPVKWVGNFDVLWLLDLTLGRWTPRLPPFPSRFKEWKQHHKYPSPYLLLILFSEQLEWCGSLGLQGQKSYLWFAVWQGHCVMGPAGISSDCRRQRDKCLCCLSWGWASVVGLARACMCYLWEMRTPQPCLLLRIWLTTRLQWRSALWVKKTFYSQGPLIQHKLELVVNFEEVVKLGNTKK